MAAGRPRGLVRLACHMWAGRYFDTKRVVAWYVMSMCCVCCDLLCWSHRPHSRGIVLQLTMTVIDHLQQEPCPAVVAGQA